MVVQYFDYSSCSPKLSGAKQVCLNGKGGSPMYLDLTRYFVDKFDAAR